MAKKGSKKTKKGKKLKRWKEKGKRLKAQRLLTGGAPLWSQHKLYWSTVQGVEFGGGQCASVHRCAMMDCDKCGARLHSCKLEDHAEICPAMPIHCPCAGCTTVLPRRDLGCHLSECRASVAVCYLCGRLFQRMELSSHIQNHHRENSAFEHCPLGCGACVPRQLPMLQVGQTQTMHRALLEAIAADTHPPNLLRAVRWQQSSAPAHLAEYILRNGTTDYERTGKIHRWSSIPKSVGLRKTNVATLVSSESQHLHWSETDKHLGGGGDGAHHRHLGGGDGAHHRHLIPPQRMLSHWPIHGSLEPPPLPATLDPAAMLSIHHAGYVQATVPPGE